MLAGVGGVYTHGITAGSAPEWFGPYGWVIPAALLLLITVRAVYHVCRWRRPRKPALPGLGFTLIYSDRTGGENAGILTDEKYQLQGKPDMIYRRGRTYIPVELKSGSVGGQTSPRAGDMMQLAVYFRLVEAEYGARPRQGRLIYRDAMFIIKNNRALRTQLLSTLAEMRAMLDDPASAAPAQPSFPKCRGCVCRGTVCGAEDEVT